MCLYPKISATFRPFKPLIQLLGDVVESGFTSSGNEDEEQENHAKWVTISDRSKPGKVSEHSRAGKGRERTEITPVEGEENRKEVPRRSIGRSQMRNRDLENTVAKRPMFITMNYALFK